MGVRDTTEIREASGEKEQSQRKMPETRANKCM